MRKKVLMLMMIVFYLIPFARYPAFAETLYLVTIQNENTEGQPLFGFRYEIRGTGFKKEYDLLSENTVAYSLPAGTYTMVEIERPDSYEKAPDVIFSVPLTDNGIFYEQILLKPKHIPKASEPSPPAGTNDKPVLEPYVPPEETPYSPPKKEEKKEKNTITKPEQDPESNKEGHFFDDDWMREKANPHEQQDIHDTEKPKGSKTPVTNDPTKLYYFIAAVCFGVGFVFFIMILPVILKKERKQQSRHSL